MTAAGPEADAPAAAGPGACAPAVTALVAAVALALALLPETAALLVYDRERVLAGEIWRLITGHAVHLSWTHAGWNLILFAVAGAWLERRDRARYLWLIALTALASSLWFLIALPDMARYAGLSGVVSAMAVYLCLQELRRDGPVRLVWATILLLFAAKIGYELMTGQPLFATPDATSFEVVPAAHIIGAVVAVVVFVSRSTGLPHVACIRSIFAMRTVHK